MPCIYLLVLPGVHLLDLAGPLQVLATVPELGIGNLGVRCIGPEPGVRSFQGVALDELASLPQKLAADDALVVIGSKLDSRMTTSHAWRLTARWLHDTFGAGRMNDTCVASVCTGAFLLGDAGLLDGHLCTTHHRFQQALARRFPAATVLDNRIFVIDGRVWTSAGVASGIDLALQLVAHRYGDEAAVLVARENVVPFRRFGGDPGLRPQLKARSHANQLVHRVQDAMARELDTGVHAPAFVGRFAISARHLSRVFQAETGMTLKAYQSALRIARAEEMLQRSELPIEQIAQRCGYGSVQAFRAQWNQVHAITPSAYRLSRQPPPM